MTRQGFINSKSFWNTDKPFITNKCFFTCENITMENKRKFINDDLKLTEVLNIHYINIVANSSGVPLSIRGNPNNPLEDSNSAKNIIEEYKNHSSIINMRNQTNLKVNTFDFPYATKKWIKLLKA